MVEALVNALNAALSVSDQSMRNRLTGQMTTLRGSLKA